MTEKIWLIGNCRDDPPVLAAVACASTAGTGELPTPSSTIAKHPCGTAGATTPANPREPKIFSLLASFILIAVLAGCGSVTGGNTPEPNPNKVEPYPNDSTPGDVLAVTPESGIRMRVLWTVSGYVIGKGATWDEQDAKALLFKPLDITDTEITFDGQVCKNVKFQQETVNADKYLSSAWQSTPQTLGIEDQELQVFKTNCALPGFQEYMRLGDGQLIVPMHGVFFFFEPAVTR